MTERVRHRDVKPVQRPTSIDVWWSPEGETAYSISLCDQDDEEIRCLGGDDNEDAAWAQACEHADALGLPACMTAGDGSSADRAYEPKCTRD